MRRPIRHFAPLTALLALAAPAAGFVALAAPSAAFAQAAAGDVVINEVAWMGSTTDALDEWVELFNNTGQPVDLTGWTLWEGTKDHALSGTIPAGGFYLIERREEATSVPADLITSISLANGGEELSLTDPAGHPVDLVPTDAGWFAGTNGAPKATMERVAPTADANQAASWADNDGVTVNGTDSGGLPVGGTPKSVNSTLVDSRAPAIRGVLWRDATTLVVVFDEPVDAASAAVAAGYTVAGTAAQAADVDATDPAKVVLQVAPLEAGAVVPVAVNGVTDAAGNAADAAVDTYVGQLSLADVQADDPATAEPSLQADTFITVEGLVGATVFSEHETNLYDLTGGVALYDSELAAVVSTGERLRVAGVINFYNGKTELGTGGGSLLYESQGPGGELPVLVLDAASWAADPESFEGRLVAVRDLTRVAGTWPESGNANLFTEGPFGAEVTVRIDEDTDLSGSPQPQWPRTIQGIAGQFDPSSPYTDGHQVIPRAMTDILSAPPCTCAPETLSAYWCRPLEGACTVVACVDGLGDCDGDPANGCEAELSEDTANCGACGEACGATELCEAGACVPACPDADQDGWPAAACGGSDCNDSNRDVNPGRLEICGNGLDDDCVGGDEPCEETDGGVTDGGQDPADGGGGAPDGGDGEGVVGTPSSCGCSAVGGTTGAGWALLLLGLVVLRRRRR